MQKKKKENTRTGNLTLKALLMKILQIVFVINFYKYNSNNTKHVARLNNRLYN